jgi:hypothetical protein
MPQTDGCQQLGWRRGIRYEATLGAKVLLKGFPDLLPNGIDKVEIGRDVVPEFNRGSSQGKSQEEEMAANRDRFWESKIQNQNHDLTPSRPLWCLPLLLFVTVASVPAAI